MKIEEKFIEYEKLLKEWSTKMNLVAPSTLTDIQNRHIKDSAQLTKYIPKDVKIIDLGSGAGFPGVVLAILGWNVTCIESIGKKTKFLSELKQKLDLKNLTIVNDRIENFLSKTPVKAGNFIFTARAFAPLIKIFDYTHKTNCRLFLLKGREIETEITTAKTRYKFNYELYKSETGDGYIVYIYNLK
ncbi:MAG: 16S rRNA (guanine(527)-N(7))-methyltransferase RsmG [Alphaproteobacteria bacterium]|nr:16S rRNA (guanine(527)-N(7))-methyltransferase RsmG [Alphaproteobacteria bacterium]